MGKYDEKALIKQLSISDTRIAELETCIREQYEAMRDKNASKQK